MADLVLLHTAPAHVARFDALRERIKPDAVLRHHLRPDWLTRARDEGLSADLKAEFTDFIGAQTVPVLCTCTTLGPLADAAGATRIDRPMMQQAAETGGPVAMAYCLDSTRAPSLSLLRDCLAKPGATPKIRPLEITGAWPAFAAGDEALFARTIASAVRAHLRCFADTAVVVLAQASMAGAGLHLADGTTPVLTSPEPALRAALGL